ncbi:hypothetical protein NPIL_690781 [Nephila pilipes]|uniref:Uncharacterized protein n=1 Tax=Nephila pilipes TaxID=299642 RepID=A0A8X6P7W7_NEPPI|nr:hypothetical protein NPIL_690781 [Nephila pilipes]
MGSIHLISRSRDSWKYNTTITSSSEESTPFLNEEKSKSWRVGGLYDNLTNVFHPLVYVSGNDHVSENFTTMTTQLGPPSSLSVCLRRQLDQLQ